MGPLLLHPLGLLLQARAQVLPPIVYIQMFCSCPTIDTPYTRHTAPTLSPPPSTDLEQLPLLAPLTKNRHLVYCLLTSSKQLDRPTLDARKQEVGGNEVADFAKEAAKIQSMR